MLAEDGGFVEMEDFMKLKKRFDVEMEESMKLKKRLDVLETSVLV